MTDRQTDAQTDGQTERGVLKAAWSQLKIENKVVYYKAWHEKNVIYIKDLLDHSGNLMSFSAFQEKYETRLTFLHYLELLGAIPSIYKELLSQTFPKQIISKLQKIIQCKQKVTKLVYDNIIKDTDAFPTKAYQKHKSELNIELSKEDFLNLFFYSFNEYNFNKTQTSSSEFYTTL